MNTIRVLVIASALATAALAQADFSGKWELNATQSKNIGMMAQMKLTSTIKQTRDEVVFTNLSVLNGQEQTNEVRFDLTGKPVPNRNPMEATAETVSKWDGNRLVTTWTSPGSVAGTKSVRIETRFLSEDGRTLTMENRRGQAPPMVMIFDRK